MTDLESKFIHLIFYGCADEIAALILGLNKSDKKIIAQVAAAELEKTSTATSYKIEEITDCPSQYPNNSIQRIRLLGFTLVGCLSLTEFKKLSKWRRPRGRRLMSAAKVFKPSWIDDWVEFTLNESFRDFWDVYFLKKEGLCEINSIEQYVLSMINISIVPFDQGDLYEISRTRKYTTEEFADLIDENPEIRHDLIWRLFEYEGGGETSLSSNGTSWNSALVEIANRDPEARSKLLSLSLEALNRGFSHYRAGWFSRFHEALEPTIEERQQRTTQYLCLLSSKSTNTISFAIKALKLIDSKNFLSPEQLIEHVEPVMQVKTKSTIRAALKLVKNSVESAPELVERSLTIVIGGLIHESADIFRCGIISQNSCLTILNPHLYRTLSKSQTNRTLQS